MHHQLFKGSQDVGIPILITFSMLREDFPWLYEAGMQLYRALQNGNPIAIERSRKGLLTLMEAVHRDPFLRELTGAPEDQEMMFVVDRALHNVQRYVVDLPRRQRTVAQSTDKTTET